jgi:hypothetical protein
LILVKQRANNAVSLRIGLARTAPLRIPGNPDQRWQHAVSGGLMWLKALLHGRITAAQAVLAADANARLGFDGCFGTRG